MNCNLQKRMKKIYLDNAATTPIAEEVITVMVESMQTNNGNPSSIHQFGRKAKSSIENARKNIAKHFNVSASELVFTAGGTEADNLILQNAVINLGVQTIVTSKIEHHAVLRTIAYLEEMYGVKVIYLEVDEFGDLDLFSLSRILLEQQEKVLVSLMYVNNEIGNLLDVAKVSELCQKYKALFHSDAVQGVGHYHLDLQKIPIDFIAVSAHKFHGPKGVGFAYFKKGVGIKPMLYGGKQEKGARAGTENVHAILGMEKALAMAITSLNENRATILKMKLYFIKELKKISSDIKFNGFSADEERSSYAILNVRFPIKDKMLLFNLDLNGIAASGGSACQSGSHKGSHVLKTFLKEEEEEKASVRFSFSKYTTQEDLDYVLSFFRKRLV
ncbi:probable cysteine desulfurase [Tenacibaculum maritimum]|nr:probable cysteine desulfurase [Tenacibaculum maritimum]